MKRLALFPLAALVLAACEDATQPVEVGPEVSSPQLAVVVTSITDLKPNEPTLTWHRYRPEERRTNLYEVNIRDAWEIKGVKEVGRLPVAVHPTQIHPLMSAQHSCFTVHGREEESLNVMVGGECLKRYEIGMDKEQSLKELRRLGISYSTLFPDPSGLAKELKEILKQ